MGSSSTRVAAAPAPSRRKVALCLALLTLQYGSQPLMSKRFVRLEFGRTCHVSFQEDTSIPNIFYNIVHVKKHTSYMMTIEMSFIGSICLLSSTYQSPDGEAIRKFGFFHEWTFWTLVPVLMNAVGEILVGLVTSYAGGVRKGFVIVSALLVTALLQFLFDGKPPSHYCLMALPLVATSIFIYQKYPYVDRKKKD